MYKNTYKVYVYDMKIIGNNHLSRIGFLYQFMFSLSLSLYPLAFVYLNIKVFEFDNVSSGTLNIQLNFYLLSMPFNSFNLMIMYT